MLRTNLATRPFYNIRAVHTLLAVVALVVVIVTLFNLIEFVRLSANERSLGAAAATAEDEAARLREQAARLRAQINPAELNAVAAAAQEANAVIDQRAFSWTDLFSQFEATLPENVRITAVQPRREQDGTFAVNIGVQARRVEDVEAFIQALEAQTPFKDVLAREEQTGDNGLIEAVIDGHYMPARSAPATASGPNATGSAVGKQAAR